MTMPLPLATSQLTRLILFGILFWFIGALIIRYGVEGWVNDAVMTAIVYALIIPGTLPALLLARKATGLGAGQMGVAATIMTGTAVLCDAVAINIFPSLYGGTEELVLAGAASILWGAGVALWLGILMDRRAG